MRVAAQKARRTVVFVILLCLQSIRSLRDNHGGYKPHGLSHDHEHESEEHKEYEKNVLLGEEEEGYDGLTRDHKIKRLL